MVPDEYLSRLTAAASTGASRRDTSPDGWPVANGGRRCGIRCGRGVLARIRDGGLRSPWNSIGMNLSLFWGCRMQPRESESDSGYFAGRYATCMMKATPGAWNE